MLASTIHGRGYGMEATVALHRWIDATLPVERTYCIIDPVNTTSLALAKRLGYEARGIVNYRGAAVSLLVRDRTARLQKN